MNNPAVTRRVLRLAGAALGAAVLAVVLPAPATALPPPVPGRRPCDRITSFTPPSARPGQEVDIFIEPGSGPTLPWWVSGVQFANGSSASFVRVTQTHVRARVPLASSPGRLRVQCSDFFGSKTAVSTTDFSPIALGNSLNPSAVTRVIGDSVAVTATLSHPAPEPVVLTIAPQSTRVAVNGQNPGVADTVNIPAGQQSASFTATARAAGVGLVRVGGHNVANADLTVSIPQPSFTVTVPVTDAAVNWGNSASYAVELESENGFSGTVTLEAQNNTLPFGATAASVNVTVPANGSATANLVVATTHAGTDLGPDAFTLRSTSPGLSPDLRTLNLRVLPDDANFTDLNWTTASTPACANGVSATVSGGTVSFDGNSFSATTGLQFNPQDGYALTPDCRGAVVIGPATATGSPATIFNLDFPSQIAAGLGGPPASLGSGAYDNEDFLVSTDGSFLIAVTGADPSHNGILWNMVALSRVGNHLYTGTLSADVEGVQIHATPSGSDDWNWSLP